MKIFFLAALIAFAGAGHWEHWMVFRKDCGTVEKRCVADSLNEINPSCESSQESCEDEQASLVYPSWAKARRKINKSIYLRIGIETKKVPIMISPDGTKYLIFQRRMNGEVDFYRKWDDYVEGFGDPEGDYWIGLRALNILTSTEKFAMTVFLETFNNTQVYARYETFEVGGPETYYNLKVNSYNGTAGDAMAPQNKMMFSTQDQDHDTATENCAVLYRGAWWYAACHQSNLNGNYYEAPGNHSKYADGINWQPFMGYHVSMMKAIMALSLK